jgi:hypothetical protein
MATAPRHLLGVAVLLTCVTLAGSVAQATPTGLNNIPTADVAPQRTLVLQTFVNAAQDVRPDFWAGFKYGLFGSVEVGLDGQVNADPSDEGVLAAQVKLRLPLWKDGALGLGAANLGDESRNGEPAYYAVLSQNLQYLNIHLGGTFQEHNEGVFAGLDTTFDLAGRGFTVRVDVRQTNEREDLLSSAGFIVGLVGDLYLETWGSFPSDSDAENVVTVKLDYAFSF